MLILRALDHARKSPEFPANQKPGGDAKKKPSRAYRREVSIIKPSTRDSERMSCLDLQVPLAAGPTAWPESQLDTEDNWERPLGSEEDKERWNPGARKVSCWSLSCSLARCEWWKGEHPGQGSSYNPGRYTETSLAPGRPAG